MDTSGTDLSGGPGEFGLLLRSFRATAGLSQAELAEKAGLSARAISDLERGMRRSPYPTTIRRLARALSLRKADRSALLVARQSSRVSRVSHERRPDPAPSSNLPIELSSFIGRKREITAIKQLLHTTRLLTLIGAGGVGKTRLALRVMSEVAHSYTDGVWLVDLAPVADPTLVPKAVASALDVQEQPGRALVDTLADGLRHRTLLLLLDNCEHLVQRMRRAHGGAPRSLPTPAHHGHLSTGTPHCG
jgi:transcriptional regulator with XRE-family HTH domain